MATAIPLLVLAGWLLRWQGLLWRRTVATEAHDQLVGLVPALQAELRPLWSGWEVRSQRARVQYRGGLFGFRTRIRAREGRRVAVREGLASVDEVLAVLEGWERER